MEVVPSPNEKTNFPILYAVNKGGKIKQFEIFVTKIHSGARIISCTGNIDGAKRNNSKFIKSGKNIGKSNETTPYEQAISEAQSDWNGKLKEGYKSFEWLKTRYEEKVQSKLITEFKENNNTIKGLFSSLKIVFNTDHNDRVKPMLANKFDRSKHNKFPYFIQPKFNGVRCISFKEGENIVMISREGEEYDLPHIRSEVKQLLKIYPDIKLDGELYIHGTKLQDIIHHLRTTKSTQLCYHVYDLAIENSKQWNRTNRIDHMRKVFNTFQHIKFVDTPLCQNINDITLFDTNIRKEGYEGSIIRTYQGDYDFGFRSNDLLKLKTTLSEDFIIVGHTIKDNSNDEDFVLICETPRGKTFEVKPHGTIDQRLTMLHNIDSITGLKVQLEFFEYTKDMIPFHITSVVIRNYE